MDGCKRVKPDVHACAMFKSTAAPGTNVSRDVQRERRFTWVQIYNDEMHIIGTIYILYRWTKTHGRGQSAL